MLILDRNKKQTLCIGDDVTITVLEVQGDQVRFGIQAPKDVVIQFQEAHESPRAVTRVAMADRASGGLD